MKTYYPVFVSYVASDGLVRGMKFVFLLHPVNDPKGMTELVNNLFEQQGSVPTITFIQQMERILETEKLDEQIQEYVDVFQRQKNTE